MIVDTSAIVAAIAREPDGQRFRQAMLDAPALAMSAVTVLETRIVLRSRYGDVAVQSFEELLAAAVIEIVPFDDAQATLAFAGFCRFGKGQGHAAQLNIVDCAAYALARSRGDALLYKGEDFSSTDIVSAL